MTDIPRYSVGRGYVIDANDNGPLVKYANHVAALLTQDRQHMEQQAAAVAAAERQGFHRGWTTAETYWREVSIRYGRRKVREARDAVAALGMWVPPDALAAIDALEKP